MGAGFDEGFAGVFRLILGVFMGCHRGFTGVILYGCFPVFFVRFLARPFLRVRPMSSVTGRKTHNIICFI